jgi:hypothetical protein
LKSGNAGYSIEGAMNAEVARNSIKVRGRIGTRAEGDVLWMLDEDSLAISNEMKKGRNGCSRTSRRISLRKSSVLIGLIS